MKAELLKHMVTVTISLILLVQQLSAWTFVTWPDPHNGSDEGVILNGNCTMGETKMWAELKDGNHDMFLISGDIVSGHWWYQEYIDLFGANAQQRVLKIADSIYDCYKNKIDYFNITDKLLVAPGDHEFGDNSCWEDAACSKEFIYYREAFAKAFNLDSQGNSKYIGQIGTVPQKPVGTDYENTSYAIINKNVMIVTLDLHRFDGSDIQLGSNGTVSAELTPDHEEWLDAILAAGRAIDSIDFIVVQSHYGVIRPIFYEASSGVVVKDGTSSSLYKTLTKHNVDVYIAGEVHALSVIMDPASRMVQFMHGGPFKTYAVWEVADDLMTIKLSQKDDNEIMNVTGEMTIRKTSTGKTVSATGAMSPMDVAGALTHYSFDIFDTLFANTGVSSPMQYRGINSNVTGTQGVLSSAAQFNASNNSHVTAVSIKDGKIAEGMIMDNHPRSISAWVKTTSSATASIVSAENLRLKISGGKLSATGGIGKITSTASINDGTWHHVAVTCPVGNSNFENSLLYIDGAEAQKASVSTQTSNWAEKEVRIIIGGNRTIPGNLSELFTGSIDDVAFWGSAVPSSMIKAMYNSANSSDLKYNAARMDSLFHIYRTKQSGNVDGKTWKYGKCPDGQPGTISKSGSYYYIVLDQNGYGVSNDPSVSFAQNTYTDHQFLSVPVFSIDKSVLTIINMPRTSSILRLYSISGGLLLEFPMGESSNSVSIDLADKGLASGIYTANLSINGNKLFSQLLIYNR